MMQCRTLFLSGFVLFVLISFLSVNSVGASSEMCSQTYGGKYDDIAYSLVETSDGGFALAGYTRSGYDDGTSNFWLVRTDKYGVILEFPHDEKPTTPTTESFPTWIVATIIIVAIAVVGVSFLVYFAKVRKTTGKTEIISEGVK